jgi:hypothetical protein
MYLRARSLLRRSGRLPAAARPLLSKEGGEAADRSLL